MPRKPPTMPGDIYGRLTAVGRVGENHRGRPIWRFKCACGGEKDILVDSARNGATTSCGCLNVERARRLSAARVTHGKTDTPEYRAWIAMKERCLNEESPAFGNYGARGITVCERWMNFENFYKDMGPRPDDGTLERRDNDMGYDPDNCRWASTAEQNRNQRTTHFVDYQGERLCLSEAARRSGINHYTVRSRIEKGWSAARALSEPPRVRRWHKRP